jgi:hypothetical protein
MSKAVVVGFADEFFGAIAKESYFRSQNSFWIHSYNGEPSVNLQFFKRFLAQHQIRPLLNAKLESVQMDGRVIALATFDGIGPVKAKVFIDASYEGDLLTQAGCSYFIGREANAQYGETHNGVRDLNKTAAQFPDNVDPYIEPGNPASGLLPFVSAAVMPAVGSACPQVEAFCYRLVLTNYGPNQVALPEPTTYDP